jgi:hypothetical protein
MTSLDKKKTRVAKKSPKTTETTRELNRIVDETANSNKTGLRMKKASNKMNQVEWNAAAHAIVADLLPFGDTYQEITELDFQAEEDEGGDSIRITLPAKLLHACKKLPWFHKKIDRFRQTLAKKRRHGLTLRDVVRAMNFLFQRTYSADEIEFLRDYFQRMEIPLNSECLTTIVEVSEDFNQYLETVSAEAQVIGHKRVRDSDLEDAVAKNSQFLRLAQRPEVTEALLEHDALLRTHQSVFQSLMESGK